MKQREPRILQGELKNRQKPVPFKKIKKYGVELIGAIFSFYSNTEIDEILHK